MKRLIKSMVLVLLSLAMTGFTVNAGATREIAEFDGWLITDSECGMSLLQPDYSVNAYILMDSEFNVIREIETKESLSFSNRGPFIEMYDISINYLPIGLLNYQGEIIVPPGYQEVEVLSDRWQLGVQSDGMLDVFFDGRKIGTLDSTYSNSSRSIYAFGAYLILYDQDWNKCGIDGNFNIFSDPDMWGWGEFSAKIVDDMLRYYHAGSGQQAFVPGCTLNSDDLDSPYLYRNGYLYDICGRIIAQTSREYSSIEEFINGYAVSHFDSKSGLIRLDGSEVAPPAYDGFFLSNCEPNAGYFSVLKEDKIGFMDLSGKVICDFLFPYENANVSTPFIFYDDYDLGQITIVSAAVGELPERYKDVWNRYNGIEALIVQNLSGQWGIIDLYGETIFPFSDQYMVTSVSKDISRVVTYDSDNNKSHVFSLLENEPDMPVLPSEPDVPVLPSEPDVPALPPEPDGPAVPADPALPDEPDSPSDFQIRFCPNCGYQFIVAPLHFCPNCGYDLTPFLGGTAK